ncbi:low affinity iron permease family protein [Arthrobacter dokdonensis]|uniref:low affinity iron permease family protein n=1 Tax=Arthrobacter dokdonellae TaxID=2211210 RepID=UPI000DE59BF2|nr:low affinity iron permease family protein [Arthrobacter dokdonellae]
MSPRKKEDVFSRFTTKTSTALGRPPVFIGAVAVLILWAVSGPLLGFSDTWQLLINTGTTIVTFLMVFIIQNTQNRDNLAINLKLDALMMELKVTNSKLYGAEENGEKALQRQTRKIRAEADEQDPDTPDNAHGDVVAG